jgi:putative membrane protein
MLILGPLGAAKDLALVIVFGVLGMSASRDGFEPGYVIAAAVGATVVGLVPWLTTRYRLTETQFQQRTGLVNRKRLTAPLDRVRSVDLEASLAQRLLGVTTMRIGTGVDETRIELKALAPERAVELRHALLARRRTSADIDDWSPTAPPAPATAPIEPGRQAQSAPEELARIDWSWLRFAPLSLSRLAVLGGLAGAFGQFGDDLPIWDSATFRSTQDWVAGFAIWVVVAGLVVATAVGWLLLSIVGYAAQWWDMRLVRQEGNLRLTSGLFTTRSTTVEEARIRGVEFVEPVLLRLADGAELATLATGIGSGGKAKVLPPCPRRTAAAVGADVLGTTEPISVPTRRHGSYARRRVHVKGQFVTVAAGAVAAALIGWTDVSWELPAALVLLVSVAGGVVAEAAYRQLGHALTSAHLVFTHGAITRTRTALELDGIVGWTMSQSILQRRVGLANLVAATAAGAERIVIPDVPLPVATEVMAAAAPQVVEPFLAPLIGRTETANR